MKSPNRLLVFAAVSASFTLTSTVSAVVLYAGPPGVMTSNVSPGMDTVVTENFNGFALTLEGARTQTTFPSPYTTPGLGTYTTLSGIPKVRSGSVLPTSDFGGGPGEGDFLGIVPGATVQLTLTQPANYLGFAWLAGDQFNSIELYDGGILIDSFTTNQIINLFFNNPTVDTVGGGTYNSADYFGQPGTGFNASEPYVYIHVISQDAFDEIRFIQPDPAGGKTFETDNHTVLFGRIPDPEMDWAVVPEPTTYAMIFGVVGLAIVIYRRRK